jgi:hypothetical protein
MKARELASVDSKIKMTRETIKECEKRYAGWKKTHTFDKPTKEWRTI